MSELTAEQIAQRTIDLNLLDDRQLQAVWGEFGRRNIAGDDFVQALVRRELLTNYQVERLLKGERTGFFYGPYKVLYRVATGSFARVYRAVDTKSGRIVALKVLRKRYCDEPAQTDQFAREGELGRTLRHPNIVPIYEVVSSGTSHFLVMEFVEGRNLREFVRVRQKLDPVEATHLMIGIADGMRYAHDRGVCHRDLKMTNVLISSRGVPRLVDFGLASEGDPTQDDPEDESSNPRTIDYAGLERATGVRKDDTRSDIYFMGCIFYNMLTGQPPLQETKDRIQRLSRTRYTDVVPIQKVDPALPKPVVHIVNKAMELDVSKRYQSPAEMFVDLNITARRMASGQDLNDEPGGETDEVEQALGSQKERDRWTARLLPTEQRRVLMIVEGSTRMQDVFRDGLKRSGYRVLLTSDPLRPASRFEDDEKAADCVIYSSGNLGHAAVDAFNDLGEHEKTRQIPAIMLLGQSQTAWLPQVKTDEHRPVLVMPLKLKEFRDTLARLVPPL
ncbi:MAG: protein kinase [Pirellulales bacterium]|nr:protein kinase [Pirellulales bacterium]